MKIYEVGKGKEYRTMQDAADAAPGYCPEGLHINVHSAWYDKPGHFLSKIICWIFGHKWKHLEDSELICTRCNALGFVVDCNTGFHNVSAGELYEEDADET